MIENLLLQQVLLYTREKSRLHSRSATENSVWIRQQPDPLTASSKKSISKDRSDNEPLVLTSSKYDQVDDEPNLCLIESGEENSSHLIETILRQYNQNQDTDTNFDQNLMNLILKRNRERKTSSTSQQNGFFYRLQWLAIGLVIDRLFFYLYFTATLVSYLVTLWLIPYSHPTLKIDIKAL